MGAYKPSQARSALQQANRVLAGLAEVRAEVKALPYEEGCRRLADLLEQRDPRINSARMGKFLTWIKGAGKYASHKLLVRHRISDDRRVDELTDRQARVLAAEIRDGFNPRFRK